jgi:MFS family permease
MTSLGWGAAAALGNVLADRLAGHQRGKVAGLSGFIGQAAPVGGVVLAGAFSADHVLVFLAPGAVAALLWLPFLLLNREEDTRTVPRAEPLTIKGLLGTYVFNPRLYPDFAWNWLGNLLFFFALSLGTTFTTFFYAQRLGIEIKDLSQIVTLTAGIGLVIATVGALGSGCLSDRIGRRRPFILGAAALFAVGCLVSAFAGDLPSLLAGFIPMTLSIAVFAAANHATVLDILPERETQAGRFTAISNLAQRIAAATAPLVAPLLVTIDATAYEKNYTVLYLVSALLGLTSGVLIFFKVKRAR